MILRKRPQQSTLAAEVEYLRRRRKTGRLTLTHPEGHGDFYFNAGELVDAKVDQVSGPGAIFLALTLQNTTFKFDPAIRPTQRTIHDPWEVLVSDAQRQLNEGNLPSELFLQDDEFETAWSGLIEKPLSSVRRTAVYRASMSKWRAFSDYVTSLIHRFTSSVGWGVAFASAIFAFTVLVAISIVALNQGFKAQPPVIVPAEENAAPDARPAAGRPAAQPNQTTSAGNNSNVGILPPSSQPDSRPAVADTTAPPPAQPESVPAEAVNAQPSEAVPPTGDPAPTQSVPTSPPVEEMPNEAPQNDPDDSREDENDVPEPEPTEDEPADQPPNDTQAR